MDGLNVFDELLYVYDKYIVKGCNNKKKIYLFEKNKMTNINNINNIYNKILNYNVSSYNIFLIKYPKYRIVMSLNMYDKVINQYITLKYLIPNLSKHLDDRNIATRKGYGIKLLKRYIEKNKKYNKFYILKLDISKYFYNIDHDILKDMIKDKLDSFSYNICSKIIDSTNESYINKKINLLKKNNIKYGNRTLELQSIPVYKCNKGLPIGNMTSQFFAIFYLYKLNHFIVHNLNIKYMIRYMDDYVLIHNDKNYLNKCLEIISNKLEKEYKLKLNNKCKIYDSNVGFEFLGYRFKVINNTYNKVIRNLNRKFVNYNNNYCYYYNSFSNYYNSFKYSNSF